MSIDGRCVGGERLTSGLRCWRAAADPQQENFQQGTQYRRSTGEPMGVRCFVLEVQVVGSDTDQGRVLARLPADGAERIGARRLNRDGLGAEEHECSVQAGDVIPLVDTAWADPDDGARLKTVTDEIYSDDPVS